MLNGGFLHNVWECSTVNHAKQRSLVSSQKISMVMPEEYIPAYTKDPIGFMKQQATDDLGEPE
jgi:hypothetical protein